MGPNASSKSIHPGQPAQPAQADLGGHFSFLVIFVCQGIGLSHDKNDCQGSVAITYPYSCDDSFCKTHNEDSFSPVFKEHSPFVEFCVVGTSSDAWCPAQRNCHV